MTQWENACYVCVCVDVWVSVCIYICVCVICVCVSVCVCSRQGREVGVCRFSCRSSMHGCASDWLTWTAFATLKMSRWFVKCLVPSLWDQTWDCLGIKTNLCARIKTKTCVRVLGSGPDFVQRSRPNLGLLGLGPRFVLGLRPNCLCVCVCVVLVVVF